MRAVKYTGWDEYKRDPDLINDEKPRPTRPVIEEYSDSFFKANVDSFLPWYEKQAHQELEFPDTIHMIRLTLRHAEEVNLGNTAVTIWEETNKARFERLKENLKEEAAHLSNPSDIAMLDSYQMIIGMGWRALPYILEDLNEGTYHWFWALQAITGENPIDEEDYGKMRKMAEAWISWGRERNLVE